MVLLNGRIMCPKCIHKHIIPMRNSSSH